MAVQYDSDKDKFENWFDLLNDFKKTPVEMDDNIKNLLNTLNIDGFDPSKLQTLNEMFDDFDITSEEARKDLEAFFGEMDAGGDIVAQYEDRLNANQKALSGYSSAIKKAKSILKSFGAALGSMAVNWAIGQVIGFVVTQIDKSL